MAGTVSQLKEVGLAGGKTLVTGRLTISNLGGGSESETYTVDRLRSGDVIVAYPSNELASAFAGVWFAVSANGTITQTFDADDPAGTETWDFVAIASI
jgi:hypothetical protein